MPCMKWIQRPSVFMPQLPCGLPGPLLLNMRPPHASAHLVMLLSKSAAHALLHRLTVPDSRDPRAGRAEGCSMLCVLFLSGRPSQCHIMIRSLRVCNPVVIHQQRQQEVL